MRYADSRKTFKHLTNARLISAGDKDLDIRCITPPNHLKRVGEAFPVRSTLIQHVHNNKDVREGIQNERGKVVADLV
jgi:hypothetical protein